MLDSDSHRWGLIANGEPIATSTATLFPVLWRDQPAMLKLSSQEDQQRGAGLMEWWNGDGAAVFARDENALLMERATGSRSLAGMVRDGRDDEACRILCATAAKLHAARVGALPDLVPLDQWLRGLEPAAATHGGILLRCANTAQTLPAEPQDRIAARRSVPRQRARFRAARLARHRCRRGRLHHQRPENCRRENNLTMPR